MTKTLCLLACASISPFTLANQPEKNRDIERIAVISSRIDQPLNQTATSISLLDLSDLNQRYHLAIADVLRTLPGVGVSNSGGTGKSTTLRIRGEEGYRTRLFIDGLEVSDPSAPQVMPIFDDVLSNHIARIEVLRGPQGLVYGADAGGVVSIHTPTPDDTFEGDLAWETGRYGSQQWNGSLGTAFEQGYLYASATDLSVDGFNAQSADDSGETDGYDNRTYHVKGGFQFTPGLSLALVVRDSQGDNQYDQCFDNVTFARINDCLTETDTSSGRLSLQYDGERFAHTLSLTETDFSRQFINGGEAGYASQGETRKLDYLGHYSGDTLDLVFGLDRKRETLTNEQLSRDNTGAFIELQQQLNATVRLNAALRQDDNDTFGKHTSYRLGGVYLMTLEGTGDIRLRASYGTGFRAPSLYEQGYNDGPFAYGDAAGLQLSEETSRGLDLGVEYTAVNGISAELVYFNQRLTDAIVFDNLNYQGYFQAQGTSRSEGLEASLVVAVTRQHQIDINYTYNDTSDAQALPRPQRPRHQLNLMATTRLLADKLNLSAQWRFVRDVRDISGLPLDDYHLLSVISSYQFSDNLRVTARVENLLNESYTEVVGYNTAGRSLSAGLQYRF